MSATNCTMYVYDTNRMIVIAEITAADERTVIEYAEIHYDLDETCGLTSHAPTITGECGSIIDNSAAEIIRL